MKMRTLLSKINLARRVVYRRARLLGWRYAFRSLETLEDAPVLYLDLGTHRQGLELDWLRRKVFPRTCRRYEIHGFEASPETYRAAAAAFAESDGVQLHHLALCYDIPANGRIVLHCGGSGYGDSIYRKGDRQAEVEAKRLSQFIAELDVDLSRTILLVRMNIEGAEYDVVRDLIETGIVDKVDGWYGSWDDVGKIDPQRGREFDRYLEQYRIKPISLNGLDFFSPWRLRCIEYDVSTSLAAGARRVAAVS